MVGDIGAVIDRLVPLIAQRILVNAASKQAWLAACSAKKAEWGRLKAERTGAQFFEDPLTKRRILTEPTAIRVVADFARSVQAIKIFDAGDVQANGFQIVEDERSGETFTETGASYM